MQHTSKTEKGKTRKSESRRKIEQLNNALKIRNSQKIKSSKPFSSTGRAKQCKYIGRVTALGVGSAEREYRNRPHSLNGIAYPELLDTLTSHEL